VPIHGVGGEAVGALSLTMPTERFQRAALERRFLRPLRRATAAISVDLGGLARAG